MQGVELVADIRLAAFGTSAVTLLLIEYLRLVHLNLLRVISLRFILFLSFLLLRTNLILHVEPLLILEHHDFRHFLPLLNHLTQPLQIPFLSLFRCFTRIRVNPQNLVILRLLLRYSQYIYVFP